MKTTLIIILSLLLFIPFYAVLIYLFRLMSFKFRIIGKISFFFKKRRLDRLFKKLEPCVRRDLWLYSEMIMDDEPDNIKLEEFIRKKYVEPQFKQDVEVWLN